MLDKSEERLRVSVNKLHDIEGRDVDMADADTDHSLCDARNKAMQLAINKLNQDAATHMKAVSQLSQQIRLESAQLVKARQKISEIASQRDSLVQEKERAMYVNPLQGKFDNLKSQLQRANQTIEARDRVITHWRKAAQSANAAAPQGQEDVPGQSTPTNSNQTPPTPASGRAGGPRPVPGGGTGATRGPPSSKANSAAKSAFPTAGDARVTGILAKYFRSGYK